MFGMNHMRGRDLEEICEEIKTAKNPDSSPPQSITWSCTIRCSLASTPGCASVNP
jgi:hypothetical protein